MSLAEKFNIVKFEETWDVDGYDGLLLVGSSTNKFENLGSLHCILSAHEDVDKKFHSEPTLIVDSSAKIKRIVFSPTGSLDDDYDDVRKFYNAGFKGMQRLIGSGSKRPFFLCEPSVFRKAYFAAASGALEATYVPIERRNGHDSHKHKIDCMGSLLTARDDIVRADIINRGKIVMKDIGGGSPEVMTPPLVRDYVQQLFKGSDVVKVRVIDDQAELEKGFPLFSAVDRGSRKVERHRGCILELTYTGTEPREAVFLVGKGITFDTGGIDVKINGGSRFMSFDKCGAGAVAGFFQILSEVRPSYVKVVGLMAMARNNIGEEAYVPDEIITSRSGTVVAIGNTDAEGRMAMADVLCYAKELALKEHNPVLYTIATLTGHVGLTYGTSYSAIVENETARRVQLGSFLKELSFEVGDPIEQSFLRCEDFEFIKYPGDKADILQCNTLPSSRTPRGHIFPAAFLIRASGLDKYGLNSKNRPLTYCHLDIACSSMPLPGTDVARTGSLTTLAYNHIFKRS
ncbi:hypothetical protein ACOME3_008095 [Neoechinorhynchus agilis]